ncbi:Tub domain-containing protein [Haematococcus lacustris]|uniref:Tub domain-containing protein n=1 Tax=Haematococcus lacustris TaxID=44745 RepID=A0A699ZPA9_HAELA|nr:Tub domain-containing protein [Haematococcus lacustris]
MPTAKPTAKEVGNSVQDKTFAQWQAHMNSAKHCDAQAHTPNWMSSSESENERVYERYQPVLDQYCPNSPGCPSPASPQHQWPKDGGGDKSLTKLNSAMSSEVMCVAPLLLLCIAVNVYSNELFTEGMAEDGAAKAVPSARPGSAAKMQAQKSSLAQRRAARMQGSLYQQNDTPMTRNPDSPVPRPPSRPQQSSEYAGRANAPASSAAAHGLASVFDPNEEAGLPMTPLQHRQGFATQPQALPPPRNLDTSDIPSFLMQPGRMDGPVLCYIIRDKGSAKMYPKYTLHLEDGRRFLLAARKRKKQTTSNYLISLDQASLSRESSNYFGKLRANFVGTEFTIFDGGVKPEKKASGDNHSARQELGCITYQYNVLGTRGPRKMTAVIPAVSHEGRRMEADNLLERVKANKGLEDMVVMRNKPPRWNEDLNAYCLNFSGRVTEASVKNFQLVTDDNQNHVILQLAKTHSQWTTSGPCPASKPFAFACRPLTTSWPVNRPTSAMSAAAQTCRQCWRHAPQTAIVGPAVLTE